MIWRRSRVSLTTVVKYNMERLVILLAIIGYLAFVSYINIKVEQRNVVPLPPHEIVKYD